MRQNVIKTAWKPEKVVEMTFVDHHHPHVEASLNMTSVSDLTFRHTFY